MAYDPENPLEGRCGRTRGGGGGHRYDGVECTWCGEPYDPWLSPGSVRDADHAGPCFDGCRHWRDPWEREAQSRAYREWWEDPPTITGP